MAKFFTKNSLIKRYYKKDYEYGAWLALKQSLDQEAIDNREWLYEGADENGEWIAVGDPDPERTEKDARERAKARAKDFLESTDNYAIRLASGEAQPTDHSSSYDCTFQEIIEKRAEMRALLNS